MGTHALYVAVELVPAIDPLATSPAQLFLGKWAGAHCFQGLGHGCERFVFGGNDDSF